MGEKNDYYLITFKEYKNSILSLAMAPKPTFKVMFENMGNQTGISVQFIKGFLQPVPSVYTKDIDTFFEKNWMQKRLNKNGTDSGSSARNSICLAGLLNRLVHVISTRSLILFIMICWQ